MNLVKIIHKLQNSLTSHYFFDRVDSQEEAFFEADKVGLIAIKHEEIIYRCFLFAIKVFAASANIYKVKFIHHIPESVVEESEQQLWVGLQIVDFDLSYVDRVLVTGVLLFRADGCID